MAKRRDTTLREQVRERYEARKELEKIKAARDKWPDKSGVLTDKLQRIEQELVNEQTEYTDQLMEATAKQRGGKGA